MSDTIRPITADELSQAEELYCNAFKVTRDAAQRWTADAVPEHTRAIIRGDRIASILTIHPYETWMFGRKMPMGGIAGVATWADFQGQGMAGQLVRSAIADMNNMGYAISILYPFSFRFYGRFGYTLSGDQVSYVAKSNEFLCAPPDDTLQIRLARFPRDIATIRQVYDSVAPIWNCMMNRSDKQWIAWEKQWNSDRRHVYIIESTDDQSAEAYFTIEDVPLAEGFEARISEIMLASDLHQAQVARFLSRMPANVKSIRLQVPRSAALWQYFREPTVETTVKPVFMARIINVPLACRQRGYESDVTGDITFRIDDECAPWNAGPWRLLVSDGRAMIDLAEPHGQPLILTIQEFSSIFTGYQKASELVVDQPEHLDTLESLDEIFYDGETRLLDFF